jgi:hypothetical protein
MTSIVSWTTANIAYQLDHQSAFVLAPHVAETPKQILGFQRLEVVALL